MRKNKNLPAMFLLLAALFVSFEAQAADDRLSVGVRAANVRTCPGDACEVAWQVELYHPFLIMERRAGWCRVKDFSGDTGWVSRTLLTPQRAVAVIRDNVVARLSPEAGSRVLFRSERGVAYKELDRKGQWVKVRHCEGETGWIHQSLLW